MDESSYAVMLASCYFCGRPFTFNPLKVPSVRSKRGTKEPVCQTCHTRVNQARVAAGLPVWPDPLPGAYEATPADEILAAMDD